MHLLSVRRVGTVLVGLAAVLALVSPAAARQPVDPATLNPPPPPEFNAVCFERGNGIECDLEFDDPPFNEPSGIVCDGVELFESSTRHVVGKRFYDANGDLLKRHFREDFAGSFINMDTGLAAPFDGQDTVIHTLSEPGNDLSGIRTTSGLQRHVSGPNGGTILVDTGRIVEDAATGEVIKLSGPHPFYDYFALGDLDALQPICDALD